MGLMRQAPDVCPGFFTVDERELARPAGCTGTVAGDRRDGAVFKSAVIAPLAGNSFAAG